MKILGLMVIHLIDDDEEGNGCVFMKMSRTDILAVDVIVRDL